MDRGQLSLSLTKQRIGSHSLLYLHETNMYGSYICKCTVSIRYFTNPLKLGILRACANSVYQASPRGLGTRLSCCVI